MGGQGSGGCGDGAGRKPGGKKLRGQQPIGAHLNDNNKRQREEEEAKEAEEAEKRKKDIKKNKKQDVERERQEKKEREEREQEKSLDGLQASTEETINNRNIGGAAGGGDGGGGDGDDDDEDCHSDDDCDTDPDGNEIQNSTDNENNATNEADNGDNATTDGTKKTKKPRSRLKHKPPKDSVIRKHLDDMKAKITGTNGPKCGQSWFPPTCIAVEKKPDPSNFHEQLPFICLFAPFKSRKLPTGVDSFKECECVHCGKKGHLESNGWQCRPQHNFDDTVWPLHQRLRCQDGKSGKTGCGKTFAAFHPKLMKQFPNVITESFPFLTAVSGVGTHAAVMDQLLVLATKGVSFTACCKSINEAKETRHHRNHAACLDPLADRVKKDDTSNNDETRQVDDQTTSLDCDEFDDCFVPKPFAPCKSAGECNGMPLKPTPMRKLFLQVMNTLEEHMQESFQMHPDESESSDHSFKFAKQILASNGAGSAHQATYDSIGPSGVCTFNRFCHTKSNDELSPLTELHKKARTSSGATELKRTEGDGGEDRSLWPLVFPELKNNTKPHRPPTQNGLPRLFLEDTEDSEDPKCLCPQTKDEVGNWALSVAQGVWATAEGDTHCGLDAEWNVDVTRDITRAFSLSLPSNIFKMPVVLDLTRIGWFSNEDECVPQHPKKLLENPRMVPVGVQVGGDASRVRKLGISMKRKTETSQMAKELEPNGEQPNAAQNLASRHLNCCVDKSSQNSDWREMHRGEELQECAALDAQVHAKLHRTIVSSLCQARRNGLMPAQSITAGNGIQLTHRKKVCAAGEMIFVGGAEGESRKWGAQFVGKGKCLVRIDRAAIDSARPVYSCGKSPDNQPHFLDSWENKNATLKQPLDDQKQLSRDLIVSWPTDGIKLFLPAMEPFALPAVEEETALQETEAQEEAQEENNNEENANEEEKTNEEDNAIDLTVEDDGDVDDGVHCPRTRMTIDRFHVFDSMPASRDSEKKALLKMVRRLVMQATTEFDLNDWNDVTNFPSERKGIHELEGLLDHFHFQREWWHQHVRVHPPPPDRGADDLQMVMDHVEKNEALKPVCEMLREWFESIILLHGEGKLSESNDVEMCQCDGTDKCGLNEWLRRRGSNRSENMHQKMRVAFGPHGVGAEVGHCLLLLVCCRCNINTGIGRKGHCNFGTMHCHPIDRTQLRMMQMFQRDIFPNHHNQSPFKPIKNFVAVGIGPLNCSGDYAQEGCPHLHLRGDMRFPADEMKLKGPPLHTHHPREKETFNKCMGEHPKPSSKGWRELAKTFLKEADCEHAFPKPPSMLQNYYNKWKHTNQLVALQSNIKVHCCDSLKKLGQPPGAKEGGADAVLNPAAEFQKKNSDENRLQQMAQQEDGGVDAVLPEDVDMDELNVAPLQAPGQTQCVASGIEDRRKKGKPLCGGAAFGCTECGNDCSKNGGWQACAFIEKMDTNKAYVPASAEEGNAMKLECDKKQNAIRKKTAREENKRKKAAASNSPWQQFMYILLLTVYHCPTLLDGSNWLAFCIFT